MQKRSNYLCFAIERQTQQFFSSFLEKYSLILNREGLAIFSFV